MASMKKKNPMNFLDPNKPYTISVEVCDSDEDELPNANTPIEIDDSDEDELPNANTPIEIDDSDEDELSNANNSEKYVEAPGLPDLNYVSPIQNNILDRQNIDNQEKNNLNNTVSSSSPVKSIQNTKESVILVEHNDSDNTSDDDIHVAETESLQKVSNNLLNIIEMDGRMAVKNRLANKEIDKIKKLFKSMKCHHFSQSYDIVISLFLPRLADKNFIKNFLDYTLNNSRVNRTFDCSDKTIKTLFWDMIKFTKYKKGVIDFHESIKKMDQNCPNNKTSDNKTCDVNNINLEQKNTGYEGTKLKTKTTKIVSNTTTNIENPQLCPNSDQIENNENEDVSNTNGISKESNGLLEKNFINSTHSNFNSKVTVKASDHKLLKSLLNAPQVVINQNTNDDSNMSVQRNETLPEERCISSELPAGQAKNNVNQETVSTQTCLQKCCQNTTSQYSSDNETVSQSDSNMYIPHLENATISKSPHVVILPPNCDKEQPNMNLTLQSNIFINQSKTPLHKNTSNHSNNQYQPSSFSVNTVVNPDNQCQLALHDNIARNPSYHPQASLHRNTSNHSNIQYQPSRLENTVNPDIHYQLALHDNIASNLSYHAQAQYQQSLFKNSVANQDNQYHFTLHDNNGINQNNRPQVSLHVNNYRNSNNQYRPLLHRTTVVNPNTNHNVPIIRGPTLDMRPNFQQPSRRYNRIPKPAPIYRPNGINAIDPNPLPIYSTNGINAINPNPPPIYSTNGINAINPNPPPIYSTNGINAINPNPPPIYTTNGINAINPNPPPIYSTNGINAINPNPPPIYSTNGINAINPNPPPMYRPNGINAIDPNPPSIYRSNDINAIDTNPPPIYRPNGINGINQYQPKNQRHNGVNPSLHTSSERVPNIRYPPKLERKRKNYQPRKTIREKNGQMNNSNTSSSTTSSAEFSEHPNASSTANSQNKENTSHQPQEDTEQWMPTITHVTSLSKKCYVCGNPTTQSYCSKRCQAWHLYHYQFKSVTPSNNSSKE